MAVASMLDLVFDGVANIFSESKVTKGSTDKYSVDSSQLGMKTALSASYVLLGFFCAYTFDISDVDGFSFFLFLGAAIQALAVLSLCLKVKGTKSVEGISSHSLLLFLISVACRLSCTMLYDGYLSADNSGDLMYQISDCVSLVGLIYLLFAVHKTYVHTYQDEYDRVSVLNLLVPMFVLATFIHGDLNRYPLFDILWAFALNLEVVMMLPQIYLLTKVGGIVDKTLAHFVANMFLSCCARFTFWAWAIPGCEELSSPDGLSWDMEISGIYILVAHALELLVMCDFMYYFIKAWREGSAVYLPKLGDMTTI